jgi:hypothetical protein
MLFREIIAVYLGNRTKHAQTNLARKMQNLLMLWNVVHIVTIKL